MKSIKETDHLPPKLHLGCGRNILQGWTNLDWVNKSGVDVVADLDDCANTPLPFSDNYFDEFLGHHVIEHLNNILPFFEEIYRVAKPEARAVFHVPYGSSDDAFEDPTHVRRYFVNSFDYFSQPCYWRADYGYRGDWQVEKLTVFVERNKYPGQQLPQIIDDIQRKRNVVKEMVVELRAVKPARPQLKDLIVKPRVDINFA